MEPCCALCPESSRSSTGGVPDVALADNPAFIMERPTLSLSIFAKSSWMIRTIERICGLKVDTGPYILANKSNMLKPLFPALRKNFGAARISPFRLVESAESNNGLRSLLVFGPNRCGWISVAPSTMENAPRTTFNTLTYRGQSVGLSPLLSWRCRAARRLVHARTVVVDVSATKIGG